MKKWFCIIIFLVLIVFDLFCIPGPRIAIYVENKTQNNLIIEYELLNGNSDLEKNYFWNQKINQQNILLHDALYNSKIRSIDSEASILIIEYYVEGPLGTLLNQFDEIRLIPFMTLLENTYKKLLIYDENNDNIISLDTLEGVKITKLEGAKSIAYIIEIIEEDSNTE